MLMSAFAILLNKSTVLYDRIEDDGEYGQIRVVAKEFKGKTSRKFKNAIKAESTRSHDGMHYSTYAGQINDSVFETVKYGNYNSTALYCIYTHITYERV